MEKRINSVLESYIIKFKDDIKKKMTSLQIEDKSKVNELLEYIYDYERLSFKKDDFAKRKRIQNSIPLLNRCNAKKSSNEQCTRRRKNGSEYCGTHTKNTPHGFLEQDASNTSNKHKLEVFVKEMDGIVYYVDEYKNVYRTEDILNEKENPQIIAKYETINDKSFIRSFLV